MSHHIKLDTPSSGEAEVLRALHRRHAIAGRTRSLADVTRFLGPHYSTADVSVVLTALASASPSLAVNPSGDDWGLTDDGLQQVRTHPDPRFVAA